MPGIRGGSFQLEYQVCRPGLEIRGADIIPHKFMVKTTTVSILSLVRLHHRVNVGGRACYKVYKHDVHLLGSRLRVLDLSLDTLLNKKEWNLDVYEGPGPAAMHRHPDSDYLLDGEWIYFVTFQGYIRIECSVMEHKYLKFSYVWKLASDYATFLEMEHIEMNIPLETSWCANAYLNSLIYCICQIQTRHAEYNLQVDFDTIFFDGPDFLSDTPETHRHRCLLAGVSVIDRFRVTLNLEQDTLMKDIGDLSRDVIIDPVLPVLTTCYDVSFKDSKTPIYHKQPMEFVSASGIIFLVIYAYGAYINLDTSYVSLRVSQTSCTGLTLGCYPIPRSGFLEIGETAVFSADRRLKAKGNTCQGSSLLVIGITAPTAGGLWVEVTFCNFSENTVISVVSQLSVGDTTRSCLMMTLNPYATYGRSRKCALSETNSISDHPHQYATTVRRVQSLQCNLFETTQLHFVQDDQYTLVAAVNPACVYVSTKVTVPCAGANSVPNFLLTDDVFLTDLTLDKIMKMCTNSISVNTSHFVRIYIEQPESLWALDEFVTINSQWDELTSFLFNRDIGRVRMQITLSISDQYLTDCMQLSLRVAYRDLANKQLVLLIGILFSGQQECSKLPFRTFLYVSGLSTLEDR